jgi:hypothetical protein
MKVKLLTPEERRQMLQRIHRVRMQDQWESQWEEWDDEELFDMQTVTVKTADLLLEVKKNHEAHRGIYETALVRYRELAVETLTAMLEDAKAGKPVKHHVQLPIPEDHSDDYLRAIKMLEMSTEEEIEISQRDFAQYVMDDWGWKAEWHSNTRSYTVRD